MKFKDLQINQRFRFIDDLKIYVKEEVGLAIRGLNEYVILPDVEVELVLDDEKENMKEIEKRSAWQLRLEKN